MFPLIAILFDATPRTNYQVGWMCQNVAFCVMQFGSGRARLLTLGPIEAGGMTLPAKLVLMFV